MTTSTMPIVTLQVAYGTGVNTAPSSWTTVSGVRNVTITRGRVARSSPAEAGTLRATVDNRTRQWDPDGPSANAANIVPQLPVRVQTTWAGTTTTIFQGYVESLNPRWPENGKDAVVDLVAVDGIQVLANKQLRDSVWALTIANDLASSYPHSAWIRLGESYGQIAADSSGNNFHAAYNAPVVSNDPGILPYSGVDLAKTFDGIDDAAVISDAFALQNLAGVAIGIMLWAKMPSTIPTSGYMTLVRSSHWTLRLNPSQKLEFSTKGFGWAADLQSDAVMVAEQTYFIAVDWDGAGTGTLYIDSVTQSGTTTTDTTWKSTATSVITIGGISGAGETPFQGKLDEVVLLAGGIIVVANMTDAYSAGATPWNGDLSGARIGRLLDAVSWPSSLRDLDTGSSTFGNAVLGGMAWEKIKAAANGEDGILYVTRDGNVRLIGRDNLLVEAFYTTPQATFGDGSGSELPYFDLELEPLSTPEIKNEAVVTREGGTDQRYSDSTSVGKYGYRSTSISDLPIRSDADASNRAIAEVLRNKDPGTRVVSMTIRPGRSAAAIYPVILPADLWTRYTVKRRPQGGGSTISKDVHVAGITHTFDASTQLWETRLLFEETDPNAASWFLMDVALVGSSNAHVSY